MSRELAVGTVRRSLSLALAALAWCAASAEAQPPAGAPAAPPIWMQFVPFILIFFIFYFLIIRPQQKKLKETQAMLAGLKKGDKVLTQGGLLAVVTGINNDTVTLKLGEDTKVECQKAAVTAIVKSE